MLQTLLHRLGTMLLVIFLQVFLFNNINLWGYAVPLLGAMLLFHTPLNADRIGTMFLAFVAGVILDAFSNTPGVAAAAMTATAFVQYSLAHAMLPKDVVEDAVPDRHLLGQYKYFCYMAILLAVHHLVYFMMEAFSFYHLTGLALQFLGSYVLSLLLAWFMELLRPARTSATR